MCTIFQWNGMVSLSSPHLCLFSKLHAHTHLTQNFSHIRITLCKLHSRSFTHVDVSFPKCLWESFFPLGLTCTFLNALSFNFPWLNIHLWPTWVTINIVIECNMNIDNYILIVCWWCTNALDTCIVMNVLELEIWIVMHVIFL